MNKEVKARLIEDLRPLIDFDQLITDIQLAKAMADVKTSHELTALNARLVEYMEELDGLQTFYESLAKTAKAKQRSIQEFLRIGKSRATQLSIIEHESR